MESRLYVKTDSIASYEYGRSCKQENNFQ